MSGGTGDTIGTFALTSTIVFAVDAVQAVRHQAAAVVAALALSSPPLLAVLFGECLEGVETFCQQLMLLAAPYTKRGPVSAAGGSSGNTTGTGTAPSLQERQQALTSYITGRMPCCCRAYCECYLAYLASALFRAVALHPTATAG